MKDINYFVVLKNIAIDRDNYDINEFIKLSRLDDQSTLLSVRYDENHSFESNPYLAFRTLQLGIPKASIYLKEFKSNKYYTNIKDFAGVLINYYPVRDDKPQIIQSFTKLCESDIARIKKFHVIVIKHNKESYDARQEGIWKPNRWQYAYQQYLTACRSITIDESVLHLISGLESLLIKGEGLLSYKACLFSSLILGSTIEERMRIFNDIRSMYNLRSKVTHGEVESLVKLLSKEDVKEKYFILKSYLSELLLKTYYIPEKDLFSKIDEIIFSSPKFSTS